jgi:hypothetical protein
VRAKADAAAYAAADAAAYAKADAEADRAPDAAADSGADSARHELARRRELAERLDPADPADGHRSVIDPVVGEFLRQGFLGLVIVGFLLGWIAPKFVLDEYRKREAVKDATIDRQAALIEKLAEKAARVAPKDE